MSAEKRLVLDTNILLGAVFGARIRSLLFAYEDEVTFCSPDICFEEARRNIRSIASRRGVQAETALEFLELIAMMVQIVDRSLYEQHELAAKARMVSRHVIDWPIVAASLLLDCAIWTDDRDFFGCEVATWMTKTVDIYLKG